MGLIFHKGPGLGQVILVVNARILIVDDEPAIRDMIQMALEYAGYTCLQAASAAEAHARILDERPDLILLDWMMPETSGYELLRRLRRDELTEQVPVIMLTAKSDENSTVSGLHAGADDYVIKPFASRELIARIDALLRRSDDKSKKSVLDIAGLKLDVVAHAVYGGDEHLNLGPTEFRLLHFLMRNPDRAYSRGQLLDHVWGANVYIDERTVDVHIRRLRKALTQHGGNDPVRTVRGAGYALG